MYNFSSNKIEALTMKTRTGGKVRGKFAHVKSGNNTKETTEATRETKNIIDMIV